MILVTGATGFLGHHLVPQLLAEGHALRVLARPTSNIDFLQQYDVEVAIVDDITDKEALSVAAQGCDALIHAAGRFRFWGDLDAFRQTNVVGTKTAIDAALAANVKRFVHVSTVVVVGNPVPGTVIDEMSPCTPQDHYQQTKFEAELLVRDAVENRNLPGVIVRPGAYYGPCGRYAFNRLFFEEPLRGWRIRVDGGSHISFPVFVPDVARGVLLALERGAVGEVYNICGQSMTHNELNKIVSELANISPFRINIPSQAVLLLAKAWTKLSRFTGREPFYPIDMQSYVFNDWNVKSDKAIAQLNFEPTSFVDGARQTLDWYAELGIGPRSFRRT